jgi:hypothetical protein
MSWYFWLILGVIIGSGVRVSAAWVWARARWAKPRRFKLRKVTEAERIAAFHRVYDSHNPRRRQPDQ